MSVSVYVEAHRKISENDLEHVVAYNALVAIDLEPPEQLVQHLQKVLGNDSRLPYERITTPTNKMISVSVRGEGDVEYGDGMIIRIADLPPDTEALRIYME